MRTTLDIDDDVLRAAEELAKRERKTAGKVMSELMREALRDRATATMTDGPSREFCGFRPIPGGGVVVTDALVGRLRDELEI